MKCACQCLLVSCLPCAICNAEGTDAAFDLQSVTMQECLVIREALADDECRLVSFLEEDFDGYFTDECWSTRFKTFGVPTCCGCLPLEGNRRWLCARYGRTMLGHKAEGRKIIREEDLALLCLARNRYLAIRRSSDSENYLYYFDNGTNCVASYQVGDLLYRGYASNGYFVSSCLPNRILHFNVNHPVVRISKCSVKVNGTAYDVDFTNMDGYSFRVVSSVRCIPVGREYPECAYLYGVAYSADCGRTWGLLNLSESEEEKFLTSNRILGVGCGDNDEVCYATDSLVNVVSPGNPWRRFAFREQLPCMCVRKGFLYLTVRNTFPAVCAECFVFNMEESRFVGKFDIDRLHCDWAVWKEIQTLERIGAWEGLAPGASRVGRAEQNSDEVTREGPR